MSAGKLLAIVGAAVTVMFASSFLLSTQTSAAACGTIDASTAGGTSIDGYSGDQLINAAAIINAAIALNIDTRGQAIGIMTAMDETGLRNDDYGDSIHGVTNPNGSPTTSLGLFQQQDNYGTPAERLDPTTAATMFFQRMLKISGWESLAPTAVAHAVQINADPDVDAKFWNPAQDIVSGEAKQFCASTASGDPGPNVGGGGGFAPDPSTVETAIAYAEQQLGQPYVFGGQAPGGWDCSGLTMMSYRAAGINIGTHSVSNQLATLEREGRTLPYNEVQRGDLLFWSSSSQGEYHVAIYLGSGMMIAAPTEGENVKIQPVWGQGADLMNLVARPS